MSDEPTFFRGRRISVYCKGGRLIKDKKTDVRYWRLKLALTLGDDDAHACNGAILSNYQHIQARQNNAGRIEIDGCVGMTVKFFDSGVSDSPLVLRMDKCFLDSFAMTWADGMTEFWLQCEHEMSDALHEFVKNRAFTRFFVEFLPTQRSLTEAITEASAKAFEDLDKLAPEDGTTWSMTDASGKVLAKSKPKGRPN